MGNADWKKCWLLYKNFLSYNSTYLTLDFTTNSSYNLSETSIASYLKYRRQRTRLQIYSILHILLHMNLFNQENMVWQDNILAFLLQFITISFCCRDAFQNWPTLLHRAGLCSQKHVNFRSLGKSSLTRYFKNKKHI